MIAAGGITGGVNHAIKQNALRGSLWAHMPRIENFAIVGFVAVKRLPRALSADALRDA